MAANLSGAAVDRDDVADRGAAVADARVERAEGELEAAAVALLDAGDEGVEAPALAVDLDDVALRDALRGEPLRGGRRAAGRRGEEARLLHRARDASAAPGRRRRPRPTRAGAAPRSPRGRCGRAAAWWARAGRRAPARAPRAGPGASRARRTRGRTAPRHARSPGRSAWRRAPRRRRPASGPRKSRRSRRRRSRRARS